MADRKPIYLTPEETSALLAVLAMVVEDEIEFVLGAKTAAYERAVAKISASSDGLEGRFS